MATEKQINANRLNAQHSTGPKTPEGKAAIRRNAVKHGLVVRDVLVRYGPGAEDPEEFEQLLEDLYEDRQPVGELERFLTRQLAGLIWRLRRVHRVEAAEIGRAAQNETQRRQDRERQWVNDTIERLESVSGAGRWGTPQFGESQGDADLREEKVRIGLREELRETTEGVSRLLALLSRVESALNETGGLPSWAYYRIGQLFGTGRGGLVSNILSALDPRQRPDVLEKRLGAKLPANHLQAIQELIHQEQADLHELKAAAEVREAAGFANLVDAHALPSESTMDRIGRYETGYVKQLSQTMKELDNLQRQRREEAGRPAPDISTADE